MAAPTVSTIAPSSGLTRGETFVVIVGTGFNPPVPRLDSEPPTGPTTRVFFDDVEALETSVISATLIHALTPRLTQLEPASVDVRVENVTPNPPGPDVVEPVTVADGYAYKRPSMATRRDHATDPAILIVRRQLIEDFRTHVLENTHGDTHPEYADAISALAAEELQAKDGVPSLKILGPVIQEERGDYALNGEFNVQTTPSPGGTFDTHHQRTAVSLTFQYVGVGPSFGVVSQLWTAVTDYLARTPRLELARDGVDKANGVVTFELAPIWEERADFRSQAGRQGVHQFEGSMIVRGVHVRGDKIREGADVVTTVFEPIDGI